METKSVTWTIEESLHKGQGLIVGRRPDGRSCLYVVDMAGVCEMDDAETDGDDWPEPPQRLVREAQRLAQGSAASRA